MRDSSFDSSVHKLDIFGSQDRSRSESPSSLLTHINSPHKESRFKYSEKLSDLNLILEKDISKDEPFSNSESESESEMFCFDSKFQQSLLNKMCYLTSQIQCKHKIIQNVDKIKVDSENFVNYEDYYENIIDSGVNLIKLSFTIYDEKNYNEIKTSCNRLKEIMKTKHVKIPIMLSMEYRIMRFDSEFAVNFKKGEKVNFSFNSRNLIPQVSLCKEKIYNINNMHYMMCCKLTSGDKIIIEFGAAVFLINKIYYKNGSVDELPKSEFENILKNKYDVEEPEREKNYKLDYKELDIDDYTHSNTNLNDSNSEFSLKFLDKFYEGRKFKEKRSINENEIIDYIETISIFNCVVNPYRPVQVDKKHKYDKYDFVPDVYFLYAEKLIKEVEFEYLILDYVNPSIFNFFNQKLSRYYKKIPILTKISDLYTLNHLDLIINNSIGVIISFNNLVTEIPFLDIVIMTEKLIKLFKRNGLSVYCHSQTLELMKKKSKPSPSDINDILLFLQSGVDGFNLGSETFIIKYSINSILSLREIMLDFMKLLPTVRKLKAISVLLPTNKTKDMVMIDAAVLYNSLRKYENYILILISDDEKFLSSFLSFSLYNHIILVTNRISIMRRFILFPITHCILVKEVTSEDPEVRVIIENNLVNLIKDDQIVKSLNKRKDSSMILVKCLKGENMETFYYDL